MNQTSLKIAYKWSCLALITLFLLTGCNSHPPKGTNDIDNERQGGNQGGMDMKGGEEKGGQMDSDDQPLDSEVARLTMLPAHCEVGLQQSPLTSELLMATESTESMIDLREVSSSSSLIPHARRGHHRSFIPDQFITHIQDPIFFKRIFQKEEWVLVVEECRRLDQFSRFFVKFHIKH